MFLCVNKICSGPNLNEVQREALEWRECRSESLGWSSYRKSTGAATSSVTVDCGTPTTATRLLQFLRATAGPVFHFDRLRLFCSVVAHVCYVYLSCSLLSFRLPPRRHCRCRGHSPCERPQAEGLVMLCRGGSHRCVVRGTHKYIAHITSFSREFSSCFLPILLITNASNTMETQHRFRLMYLSAGTDVIPWFSKDVDDLTRRMDTPFGV